MSIDWANMEKKAQIHTVHHMQKYIYIVRNSRVTRRNTVRTFISLVWLAREEGKGHIPSPRASDIFLGTV